MRDIDRQDILKKKKKKRNKYNTMTQRTGKEVSSIADIDAHEGKSRIIIRRDQSRYI